jgi:hypothetical protein
MHDATKVLLGANGSSDRAVVCFLADPSTFLAGLAVRQKSDGNLSLTLADGMFAGISAGPDLSNTLKKTAVFMVGDRIPLRLTDNGVQATGIVTISSYANLLTTTPDVVTINSVAFAAQAGAATLGTATFRAATDNNSTAASLAAQINAYVAFSGVLSAVAVGAAVTITYASKGVAGNLIPLTYTDNGGGNIGVTLSGLSGGKLSGGVDSYDYCVPGGVVYVSDTTGMAGPTGVGYSVTGAFYCKDGGPKDGVLSDGSTVKCGIVDLCGGL